MSKLRFDINVRDMDLVRNMRDAIEDGIEDATGRNSKRGISDSMHDTARGKIITTDTIWRGELIESFNTDHAETSDTWIIEFENDAEHAPAINYGAEYGEKGPPVEALIPWVQSNMPARPITDEFADPGPGGEDLPDNLQQYDAATVANAFWLQQEIKRRGIRGIHFMDDAEDWVERNGNSEVAARIRARMQKI